MALCPFPISTSIIVLSLSVAKEGEKMIPRY